MISVPNDFFVVIIGLSTIVCFISFLPTVSGFAFGRLSIHKFSIYHKSSTMHKARSFNVSPPDAKSMLAAANVFITYS